MTDKNISVQQAIRTSYHNPTNVKDARMSATDGIKRIYVPYNDSLNVNENHFVAAQTFLDKDETLERFNVEVKKGSGLRFRFEDDYYWAWDILGKKEN